MTNGDDSQDSSEPTEPSELVEGRDYTIDPETGFMVFTEHYLLNRGYCCKTGCRHCPFGYVKPD